MNIKSKHALTPKLRFPEFREQWDEVRLSHLADLISDRVGTMTCIPYTITSGLGLVSQEEKFGRTIAGNSLRNYIRLQKDDFAYNKSATKAYPEGYIGRYLDEAKAAVPNSIFTCFRVDSEKVDPAYLDFLFAGNLHGRWLRKFLTIGARAHGSLNVSDDDLMALPVPLPSPPEQQKIAECLGSLDGLIAAEGRKLAALRDHKCGLWQQLFPQPGQAQPRLRFPEFRGKGEWGESSLGKLLSRKPEYGVNAAAVPFSEDLPTYIRITDIDEEGQFTQNNRVSVDIEATEENYLVEGDIVLARTGASVGKSYRYRQKDGRLVFAGFLIRVRPNTKKLVPDFLFNYLTTWQYWDWVRLTSARSGQPGINGTEYASMPLPLPPTGPKGNELAEQKKIAACFTALNDRIAAQAAKIESLKQHKCGLMQQLFPPLEEQV